MHHFGSQNVFASTEIKLVESGISGVVGGGGGLRVDKEVSFLAAFVFESGLL